MSNNVELKGSVKLPYDILNCEVSLTFNLTCEEGFIWDETFYLSRSELAILNPYLETLSDSITDAISRFDTRIEIIKENNNG